MELKEFKNHLSKNWGKYLVSGVALFIAAYTGVATTEVSQGLLRGLASAAAAAGGVALAAAAVGYRDSRGNDEPNPSRNTADIEANNDAAKEILKHEVDIQLNKPLTNSLDDSERAKNDIAELKELIEKVDARQQADNAARVAEITENRNILNNVDARQQADNAARAAEITENQNKLNRLDERQQADNAARAAEITENQNKLNRLDERQQADNAARTAEITENQNKLNRLDERQQADNAARAAEITENQNKLNRLDERQQADNAARVAEMDENAKQNDRIFAILQRIEQQVSNPRKSELNDNQASSSSTSVPTGSDNNHEILFAKLVNNQGHLESFKQDLQNYLSALEQQPSAIWAEGIVALFKEIDAKKLRTDHLRDENFKIFALIKALFDENNNESNGLAARCAFIFNLVLSPWTRNDFHPIKQDCLSVFSYQLHYHHSHEKRLYYYALKEMFKYNKNLNDFKQLNFSADMINDPLTVAAIYITENMALIGYLKNCNQSSNRTRLMMDVIAWELEAVKKQNHDEAFNEVAKQISKSDYFRQNNLNANNIVEHFAVGIPTSLKNTESTVISLISKETVDKLRLGQPVNTNSQPISFEDQLKTVKLKNSTEQRAKEAQPQRDRGLLELLENSLAFRRATISDEGNEDNNKYNSGAENHETGDQDDSWSLH